MRILLIGQAPGPNTDPDLPLYPIPRTSTGGRLQSIMDVSRGEYLSLFERINLLPYFPGRHKRDDKFPMSNARLAASVLRPLLSGRTVVLVGRGVADAFEFPADFHDWVDWSVRRRCIVTREQGMAKMAVIPHPSGRNHWYNNQDNRDAARAFWAGVLGRETVLPAGRDVLPFVAAKGI